MQENIDSFTLHTEKAGAAWPQRFCLHAAVHGDWTGCSKNKLRCGAEGRGATGDGGGRARAPPCATALFAIRERGPGGHLCCGLRRLHAPQDGDGRVSRTGH
jgi:hypothetical protein